MQNLTKFSPAHLVCVTMIFFCANYGSVYAQGERKAFEEGDKVLSVGISGGNSSLIYSRITPSISFDYGLKGTRGIVSIGGFASYSQTNSGDDFSSYYNYSFGSGIQDSLYTISKGFKYKNQILMTGLRIGLHYAVRKWDLYAGAMISYQRIIRESTSGTNEFYKGIFSGGYWPINGTLLKTEQVEGQSFSNGKMIFSPYIGARYYLTKKVALNLELGQYTGNAGLSFKF
jgi:hypothetical protein